MLATHVVFVFLSRKRILSCLKLILFGLELQLANNYHIPVEYIIPLRQTQSETVSLFCVISVHNKHMGLEFNITIFATVDVYHILIAK